MSLPYQDRQPSHYHFKKGDALGKSLAPSSFPIDLVGLGVCWGAWGFTGRAGRRTLPSKAAVGSSFSSWCVAAFLMEVASL